MSGWADNLLAYRGLRWRRHNKGILKRGLLVRTSVYARWRAHRLLCLLVLLRERWAGRHRFLFEDIVPTIAGWGTVERKRR